MLCLPGFVGNFNEAFFLALLIKSKHCCIKPNFQPCYTSPRKVSSDFQPYPISKGKREIKGQCPSSQECFQFSFKFYCNSLLSYKKTCFLKFNFCLFSKRKYFSKILGQRMQKNNLTSLPHQPLFEYEYFIFWIVNTIKRS